MIWVVVTVQVVSLQILRLLRKAWDRKLTFTIGTSVTSGQQDTVVWNEIHHKTEFGSNLSGHGFPDVNYVGNVLAELAAQGIRDDSDDTQHAWLLQLTVTYFARKNISTEF